MEVNALMRAALVMLGLATAGSVCIAVMRLSGVPRAPDWLNTGYGVLAWLGLALVCLVALTAGIPAMAVRNTKSTAEFRIATTASTSPFSV